MTLSESSPQATDTPRSHVRPRALPLDEASSAILEPRPRNAAPASDDRLVGPRPSRPRRSAAAPGSLESPGPFRSSARTAAHAAPARAPATVPSGVYANLGKRLASLTLLVLVSPLAIVLGLPIAVANAVLFRDPRRVFFRQERVGRDGRTFRIWKFRTMREALPSLEFHSWKNGHDGLRVTRFGRFLRNTHLDELPQLINVLTGEMDFVGPRPEMVEIHEWARDAVPGFEHRTVVRPGITGLAQVTQGYAVMCEKAYAKKLDADLEYIDELSLRRDIGILLRTLAWMVEGRGWKTEQPTAVETAESSDGSEDRMSPCPAPASSQALRSSRTTQDRPTPSDRVV